MFYNRKDIRMQDKYFDEHLHQFPLGMSYVPWQHATRVCENLEDGFKAGTIFPELIKPFDGRRCKNNG